MYLEIIILQDINTNTWENTPKGAFESPSLVLVINDTKLLMPLC
jgi:hypothetical protein